MPAELEKIFNDIKSGGPFCKDILKRKDCIELKQGASKPSTSGGKKVSQSTYATSKDSLQGEVTTLKSVGIQHNLTGEMFINGNSANIKVAQANIAAKNSGSGAIRSDFSGQYTGGGTITGFRFFNSAGSITSGQFHIYGLNKHD